MHDRLTLIIKKLIMIEEEKKKKKNKEGQWQWAEPVCVYPAVVSLVSREEAGDPAASPCARGRLFEGETHAAGRTRAKVPPRNERGAR